MYDDDKEDGNNRLARKVEDIIKEMPEEEAALCNNPEVLSRLGNELDHTPEPCGKNHPIVLLYRCHYGRYCRRDRLKNAQTAKAKKSQCMTDLINRVTEALRRTGFDVTPKKTQSQWKELNSLTNI